MGVSKDPVTGLIARVHATRLRKYDHVTCSVLPVAFSHSLRAIETQCLSGPPGRLREPPPRQAVGTSWARLKGHWRPPVRLVRPPGRRLGRLAAQIWPGAAAPQNGHFPALSAGNRPLSGGGRRLGRAHSCRRRPWCVVGRWGAAGGLCGPSALAAAAVPGGIRGPFCLCTFHSGLQLRPQNTPNKALRQSSNRRHSPPSRSPQPPPRPRPVR